MKIKQTKSVQMGYKKGNTIADNIIHRDRHDSRSYKMQTRKLLINDLIRAYFRKMTFFN